MISFVPRAESVPSRSGLLQPYWYWSEIVAAGAWEEVGAGSDQ